MTNNEKKIVIEVIDQSFNGTYYREILKTLTAIQKLLYLSEKERSTTKIMRFSNTTFLHTLFIKIHFEINFKVLTTRKFYGVYYYSLMRHIHGMHHPSNLVGRGLKILEEYLLRGARKFYFGWGYIVRQGRGSFVWEESRNF